MGGGKLRDRKGLRVQKANRCEQWTVYSHRRVQKVGAQYSRRADRPCWGTFGQIAERLPPIASREEVLPRNVRRRRAAAGIIEFAGAAILSGRFVGVA